MSGQDFSGKQVGRYLLFSLLGCGAAASVYQAVDISLDDSPPLAIKCVLGNSNTGRKRQQITEIVNHGEVAFCPHVLWLRDSFEGFVGADRYFFLVFPLCETDMFRAIWKERVYWRNDALIKQVFVDLLDGVFACHKKGVFHRDLKPENIMCNADGKGIKIGDFGLSSNRRLCRDGGCGTSCYMSPECVDGGEIFYYGDPADVWSLGVILFNMVTCRYPWELASATDEAYVAFMTKEDYLLRTSPISEPLSTLLDQIWHPIPSMRLSIPAIRKAVLKMGTFYKRRPRSFLAAATLSKEVALAVVDSQQTCVGPAEDVKKAMDSSALSDTLDEITLTRLDLNSGSNANVQYLL